MTDKYSTDDYYIDSSSDVLRNKFNITDEAELERIEADYATARSVKLAENPLSLPFTITTLKTIHKALFGDIYEWAGEFRNIDITKGTARFANVNFIESSAIEIFSALKKENFLIGLDNQVLSEKAAYYMGELNAIHPFREGNGRTQRELLSQLAYQQNLFIDWNVVSAENILRATIDSFASNYGPLTKIIFENLKTKS